MSDTCVHGVAVVIWWLKNRPGGMALSSIKNVPPLTERRPLGAFAGLAGIGSCPDGLTNPPTRPRRWIEPINAPPGGLPEPAVPPNNQSK
jgi:hypothetical protein